MIHCPGIPAGELLILITQPRCVAGELESLCDRDSVR